MERSEVKRRKWHSFQREGWGVACKSRTGSRSGPTTLPFRSLPRSQRGRWYQWRRITAPSPPSTTRHTKASDKEDRGGQRLQPTQTLFKDQEVRVPGAQEAPGPQDDRPGFTQRYLEVSTVLTALKNLSREAWTAGVNSAGWWQARVTSRQWLRNCGEGGRQGASGDAAARTPPSGTQGTLPSCQQGPASPPPQMAPSPVLTLKLTGSTRSLYACRSLRADMAVGRSSMWATACVSASATFWPWALTWAEPWLRSKWGK